MTAPRALLTDPQTVRDTTTSSETAAACSARSDDIPRIDDPSAVAPADARELSRALLTRLSRLEEGTADYSYVRATLIELNISLVKYAARRFASRSEPMDDIVQVGTIGLIKAIDRFDPDRGLEFTTFALPTIIGEIKRHFRDSTWAVHVPRRLQELRLSLAKATDELEQVLDRAPTVTELAARLEVSEEEVVEGLTASNGYTAGSLDMQLETDSPDSALTRRLGFDDTRLTRFEDLHTLKPLLAALPERDRTIIALRFGEELTQAQIGQRLGISQMHVSRLLTRALATLRSGLLRDES
ncbi:B/F/G family RNA polymerase sigma-70 factor [Streptomyces tateyamensis]|uniref:B/F/G family RNA polymerase sigma-70 factor n=1 Tax=Streptomyces tateyamensis TaxID=565073 RepID=A0A2V4NHY1_9ACTN|nr:SigB/SigF/SigG family RNA polymerase sigma factor [Streptomyces tateyamensis]PYC79980.1 B/F/G family RNA polymerase sigma-70 factor [Streptomyces tateyamensis]